MCACSCVLSCVAEVWYVLYTKFVSNGACNGTAFKGGPVSGIMHILSQICQLFLARIWCGCVLCVVCVCVCVCVCVRERERESEYGWEYMYVHTCVVSHAAY